MLELTSENPNFSFLLRKNPESPNFYKTDFRKGKIYGWYSDKNSYKLFLQDPMDKMSLNDGDFSYLDHSAMTHPYVTAALITTALKSAYSVGEYISDTDNTCYSDYPCNHQINFIINSKYENKINKLLNSCGFDLFNIEKLSYNLFKVYVCKNESLKSFLQRTMVVSLLLTLMNDRTLEFITDDFIDKYINIVNTLGLGYHARHLIALYLLRNNKFSKYKDKINTFAITLQPGNSQQHREQFIKKHLTGGKTLLDVGCGEGYHSIRLCDRYEQIFSVDTDEAQRNLIAKKIKKTNISNIKVLDNYKYNEDDTSKIDILLTEVLEHMSESDASKLLESHLIQNKFNKIVITLPHYDFNKHYLLDGFRHDDHQWEFSWPEGGVDDLFLMKLCKAYDLSLFYTPIGDIVNCAPSTVGFVITHKELEF